VSSYLELARRSRARRSESGPRLASESVRDVQTVRPIHLDHEGRRLEAAGFKPKERGGKIIWQRPDTGFWVSHEMALHLLENKSKEEDQRG
jgi:hypothetical protein